METIERPSVYPRTRHAEESSVSTEESSERILGVLVAQFSEGFFKSNDIGKIIDIYGRSIGCNPKISEGIVVRCLVEKRKIVFVDPERTMLRISVHH